MIVREFYATRRDGVDLYHTYSDAGYMIRQTQTGTEYAEAVDVADAPYTYTETETPIKTPEMTTEEMLAELGAAYDNG